MTAEIPPRSLARLTGIASLVLIVAGVFAQGYVADTLINFRNADATAANILAHENLYRIGFTVYLIEMTAQLVMSVLFYYLLKPVSRSGALVMMILSVTGSIMKIVGRLFFYTPLHVLHGTGIFAGFSADQIHSLVLVLLRANDDGAAIACAFFGPATFIQGWLMMRSGFFPKWLGAFGLIGGAIWTTYYWPPLGRSLFMVAALIGLLGSLATIAWLIVYGVDEPRFRERVRESASSVWR
jgi:hypothetical protein